MRSSYDFDVVEADGEVAGNYYPISSSISISDKSSDDSLTILVDRGQAGGSLESGEIDLMLHRRLTKKRITGNRFLGERLNERGQFGDGLMVTGKHLIFFNGNQNEITVIMRTNVTKVPEKCICTIIGPYGTLRSRFW